MESRPVLAAVLFSFELMLGLALTVTTPPLWVAPALWAVVVGNLFLMVSVLVAPLVPRRFDAHSQMLYVWPVIIGFLSFEMFATWSSNPVDLFKQSAFAEARFNYADRNKEWPPQEIPVGRYKLSISRWMPRVTCRLSSDQPSLGKGLCSLR